MRIRREQAKGQIDEDDCFQRIQGAYGGGATGLLLSAVAVIVSHIQLEAYFRLTIGIVGIISKQFSHS